MQVDSNKNISADNCLLKISLQVKCKDSVAVLTPAALCREMRNAKRNRTLAAQV